MTPMTPQAKVAEAITRGVTRPVDIALETGLGQGTVEVIMTHMERSAQLVREPIGGCPSTGCDRCPQSRVCSGASGSRGPVLLKLSSPPRHD
ncbi:hypothetical protein [Corynebacterium urealyticum]|uniref:hypothetical protein n=1 Tax=Corynebacterium urealyticum TaxID=43771 RepID=UPI0002B3FC90|nr:hypothetical protein [Corynebacterium urealyticum]AGE36723.1 hypothetical protein CU7111_1132 [Corynebacterium urealyticum DSM 7111]SNV85587.1 Uncharacterised protein [Corynebacterium urealyticum]